MASMAELVTRVFMNFGDLPKEYVQAHEVHNAVSQKYITRTNAARMSDINVLLSTSSEFTPTTEPYDITNIIGKGSPGFVEIYQDSNWQPLKAINLVDLPAARANGELCCAFYGDETNGLRFFVQLSIEPSAACRIRFDKDVSSTSIDMGALLAIPNYVSELIVLEAQNSLIPRIKLTILRNQNRKGQDNAELKFYLTILSEMAQQNVADIQPLLQQWQVWAFRDRSAQNAVATRRRIPRGSNLYGG